MNDNQPYLEDHELVIAPFGPFVNFHEDEELNLQVDWSVNSIDGDKIQRESNKSTMKSLVNKRLYHCIS